MKFRFLLSSMLMLLFAGQLWPQQPPPAQPAPVQVSGLMLQGTSLREVIDQLARQLKMNIMVDEKVQGSVTLNTYGDGTLDARNLLDLILRINSAGLIQDGDVYRVVPLNELVRQPFSQNSDSKSIPEDDRPMLNLIFLKYVTVEEVSKVLSEFTDQRTIIRSYAPANLLFIMDSHRNMRRLMDIIALFDSDSFAGDRIHLFDVVNTVPSELLKDLDKVLKAISLDDKTSTVRFLPVDRIGKLIAVAPNPGVFEKIQSWIQKLDVPITSTSSLIDTYVYHVNYGRADCLAMALNMLYLPQSAYGNYGGSYGGGYPIYSGNGGNTGYNQGFGGGGGGNFGGGALFGGSSGNYGNSTGFDSGFGGSGGCGPNSQNSGSGGGYSPYQPGYGSPVFGGYAAQAPANPQPSGPMGAATQAAASSAPTSAQQPLVSGSTDTSTPPRIVANPLDNSLLIQGTAKQYQSILKLLKELDRPPRQILLEAKIYQVVMSGSFAAGVDTVFQQRTGADRRPVGQLVGGALQLQAGVLVGQARQLLSFLQLSENATNAKVISEPSLIATDSIPAHINVGSQVPVLTGTVSNLGSASTTAYQSIGSRDTGVTLQVNARINPSGVVTLMINQEISSEKGSESSAIPTPSFDQQIVQTQITMQDGDTVAIGGIISESSTKSSTGIPFLHRIPGLGAVFGSQGSSHQRTELILFMTPHVIYDNTNLLDASEQLKKSIYHASKLYVP